MTTLFANQLQSSDDFSIRFGGGYADYKDLTEMVLGDFNITKEYKVYNVELGYRFIEDLWKFPFDLYVKGGISYFDEHVQKDFMEMTLYVKLYWKMDFWQNRVRFGFGEGLSWAQRIPEMETIDATNWDGTVDDTHKFLNYLDISIDFDLGRLIGVNFLKDFYVGYTIKHRSGVFGTFDGVHGGSNYNMLTFEKNF